MRTQKTVQILTILAVAGIVAACGGMNSPTNPGPTPSQATGNIVGFVGGNHPDPHVAVITAAQLSAGVGLILDISNARHSHTVTLTGAQVVQIAGGASVSVVSSRDPHSDGNGAHQHMVTFN